MFSIGDFYTFVVDTHNPVTGGLVDADSAPTYRVYEDETATPILTGSMALLDDGNTSGLYSERIELSLANGFEEGKSYNIRILATVNGVSGATERFFKIDYAFDSGRLNKTTIATLASQISFTLTAGSADNDAYNNCIAIITDSTSGDQKAVGYISDYIGSTKTVALAADPGIFTMAVGDNITILATSAFANIKHIEDSAITADAIDDDAEYTPLELAQAVREEMDDNSLQFSAIITALTTIAGYIDTEIPAILVIAEKIDTMMEAEGELYRLTEEALANVEPVSGGFTADDRIILSGRSSHSAADVWSAGTRTLTSFGTLASDVWAVATRTLTSYGTLVSDIATAVWGAGARTLSSYGTLVADIVTAIFAKVIDTTRTFGQFLKSLMAVNLGDSTRTTVGTTATQTYMQEDGETVQIEATIDSDGNRTITDEA